LFGKFAKPCQIHSKYLFIKAFFEYQRARSRAKAAPDKAPAQHPARSRLCGEQTASPAASIGLRTGKHSTPAPSQQALPPARTHALGSAMELRWNRFRERCNKRYTHR